MPLHLSKVTKKKGEKKKLLCKIVCLPPNERKKNPHNNNNKIKKTNKKKRQCKERKRVKNGLEKSVCPVFRSGLSGPVDREGRSKVGRFLSTDHVNRNSFFLSSNLIICCYKKKEKLSSSK